MHLFMDLSSCGSKRSMGAVHIITMLAMVWHIYASGCTVRASLATYESSSLVLAGFFGVLVSSCGRADSEAITLGILEWSSKTYHGSL